MSPLQAMRFYEWAKAHLHEGRELTNIQIEDYWNVSRATAYRWLAAYFDARCWPRRTKPEAEVFARKARAERAEHPWKRAIQIAMDRKAA